MIALCLLLSDAEIQGREMALCPNLLGAGAGGQVQAPNSQGQLRILSECSTLSGSLHSELTFAPQSSWHLPVIRAGRC